MARQESGVNYGPFSNDFYDRNSGSYLGRICFLFEQGPLQRKAKIIVWTEIPNGSSKQIILSTGSRSHPKR